MALRLPAGLGERIFRFTAQLGHDFLMNLLEDFAARLATEGPREFRQLRQDIATYISNRIDQVPAEVRGRIYEIANSLTRELVPSGSDDIPRIQDENEASFFNWLFDSQDSPSGIVERPAKRQRTGTMPTQEDQTMADADTQPVSLMANGGQMTPSGSRETPILIETPTYGLQNTHTAVIPFQTYFSIVMDASNSATDVAFSLVNMYGVMTTAVTHVAVGTTTAYGSGPVDRMVESGKNTSYFANQGLFPFQAGNTPGWLDFWSAQYDSYAILGSSYNLDIQNIGDCGLDDAMIGYAIETYTVSDTTNKRPGGALYSDALAWKGMNWKFVPGQCNGVRVDQGSGRFTNVLEPHTHPVNISGTYKPYRANRIVQNDQDTKTWHQVGIPPTMREDMHLQIYSSPLSVSSRVYLNCALEVKFIIQFKDLKNQIRYPRYNDVPLEFDIPTDISQLKI